MPGGCWKHEVLFLGLLRCLKTFDCCFDCFFHECALYGVHSGLWTVVVRVLATANHSPSPSQIAVCDGSLIEQQRRTRMEHTQHNKRRSHQGSVKT